MEVLMATSLSAKLRRDFVQSSARLPEEALLRIARARATRKTDLAERDRLLAEFVVAYRCGPRELWAPVILDLLAPGIVRILGRVYRKAKDITELWELDDPLIVDEEEIRQLLIMEVLRAAATIPLHPGGRAMKTRLLKNANKYLVRWLNRDFHRQVNHRSLQGMLEKAGERNPFGSRNPSRRARQSTSRDHGN
jgi:hypothetical protein